MGCGKTSVTLASPLQASWPQPKPPLSYHTLEMRPSMRFEAGLVSLHSPGLGLGSGWGQGWCRCTWLGCKGEGEARVRVGVGER